MTTSHSDDPKPLPLRNALVELPPAELRRDILLDQGWLVPVLGHRRTSKFYAEGDWHHRPLEGVVLHYTATGSASSAIETLTNEHASSASAHFVVDRDGSIYQLVSILDRSKHAGNGGFGTQPNANTNTISIECVNWGYLDQTAAGWRSWTKAKVADEDVVLASSALIANAAQFGRVSSDMRKRKGWHNWPEGQTQGIDKLLSMLADAGVPMDLTGHQDIAAKSDPGLAFPWARLLDKPGRRKV